MRRLLLTLVLALGAAGARAEDPICYTWVNQEPPYDRGFLAELHAQDQTQVTQDAAATVLFRERPGWVRVHNGAYVIPDEGPPPPSGDRCAASGYSRLLYSGRFFVRRKVDVTGRQALSVDPNCWYRTPVETGYAFLPIGRCAVCY